MPEPLTEEDVVKVSIVTKGESYAHRRWPTDAIIRFAAAEVVTAAGAPGKAGSRGAARRLSRIRSRLRLLRISTGAQGGEGSAVYGSVL